MRPSRVVRRSPPGRLSVQAADLHERARKFFSAQQFSLLRSHSAAFYAPIGGQAMLFVFVPGGHYTPWQATEFYGSDSGRAYELYLGRSCMGYSLLLDKPLAPGTYPLSKILNHTVPSLRPAIRSALVGKGIGGRYSTGLYRSEYNIKVTVKQFDCTD